MFAKQIESADVDGTILDTLKDDPSKNLDYLKTIVVLARLLDSSLSTKDWNQIKERLLDWEEEERADKEPTTQISFMHNSMYFHEAVNFVERFLGRKES